MIVHKHKCIFIHINKCAGVAISRFLGMRASHVDAKGYKRRYPQFFSKYFKFTFVRNPWDKMVSFYHYHIRRGWDLNWDWNQANAPCFSDFLRITSQYDIAKQRRIFKNTGRSTSHMRMSNQLDWLVDKNGSLLIDFIGRFENLQEDFSIVCDKIGIPHQELTQRNKSKHKHYTEYYDDETRQIVAERYAKDIAILGYRFGD